MPAAWDFHPEAAPYQVSFPSGLAALREETATRPETESAEDGDAARLRGVIMHRALQTLALGDRCRTRPPWPRPSARRGCRATAAASLAAEIQAELAACQADPFLMSLLRPDIPGAASEWLLEDQPQPGAIRRGVIDRLAFDGKDWWLLDFKTSRPAAGGGLGSLYHPGDRKIPAPTSGLPGDGGQSQGIEPPEAIRLGIYFTACRRMAEM